jgi:integrase
MTPKTNSRYNLPLEPPDTETRTVGCRQADAGLRRGEIIGLCWSDIDIQRKLINVSRSIWNGHETETKGYKTRVIPMTEALFDALAALRHLRGSRVIYTNDGKEPTSRIVRRWLEKAQKRAGIVENGAIHRLRHTFCSMLATKGAPTMAIKELAGHRSINTTMKYMHLSPATRESAVHLLDKARSEAQTGRVFGDIVETAEKQ